MGLIFSNTLEIKDKFTSTLNSFKNATKDSFSFFKKAQKDVNDTTTTSDTSTTSNNTATSSSTSKGKETVDGYSGIDENTLLLKYRQTIININEQFINDFKSKLTLKLWY